MMFVGLVLLIATTLLVGPPVRVLCRAMFVGLVMTAANYILAVIALRLGLWTVRGAWPVFGYPLSMVFGWFSLTSCFCLMLTLFQRWWPMLTFVALAGVGGSLWDLRVHTRAGILVLGRAKRWQVVLYWVVLAFAAALLFLSWV